MLPPLYPYSSFWFLNRIPENSFFFNSGQSGLILILQVLKKRYENLIFLLPAYTCSSVVKALVFAKVEYNFVDLDEELGFEDEDLREMIHKYDGMKIALISTSLFGSKIKNYKEIFQECIVIEDRAQSFPYLLLNSADYQFFSFGRGKMVSSGGGGAVVTDDIEFKKLYDKLDTDTTFVTSYIFSLLQKPISKYFWRYFNKFLKEDVKDTSIKIVVKDISVLKMSQVKIKWLLNSIKYANINNRINISDYYFKSIDKKYLYELSGSIPYLRFPIKKNVTGSGISSMNYADTLYEAKKLRNDKRFLIPTMLAEQSSMLPTHDLVEKDYVKVIVGIVNE